MCETIPKLRNSIKEASMSDLKDFLENIRKHSDRIGEIAMKHVRFKNTCTLFLHMMCGISYFYTRCTLHEFTNLKKNHTTFLLFSIWCNNTSSCFCQKCSNINKSCSFCYNCLYSLCMFPEMQPWKCAVNEMLLVQDVISLPINYPLRTYRHLAPYI